MNMLDKADAMKLRTKQFATRIVGVVRSLPNARGRCDWQAVTSLRDGGCGELSGGLPGAVACGVCFEGQHRS